MRSSLAHMSFRGNLLFITQTVATAGAAVMILTADSLLSIYLCLFLYNGGIVCVVVEIMNLVLRQHVKTDSVVLLIYYCECFKYVKRCIVH